MFNLTRHLFPGIHDFSGIYVIRHLGNCENRTFHMECEYAFILKKDLFFKTYFLTLKRTNVNIISEVQLSIFNTNTIFINYLYKIHSIFNTNIIFINYNV